MPPVNRAHGDVLGRRGREVRRVSNKLKLFWTGKQQPDTLWLNWNTMVRFYRLALSVDEHACGILTLWITYS